MLEFIMLFILIVVHIAWVVSSIKDINRWGDYTIGQNQRWYERLVETNEHWCEHLTKTENNLHGAMQRIIDLEEKVKELENGKENKDGLQ